MLSPFIGCLLPLVGVFSLLLRREDIVLKARISCPHFILEDLCDGLQEASMGETFAQLFWQAYDTNISWVARDRAVEELRKMMQEYRQD